MATEREQVPVVLVARGYDVGQLADMVGQPPERIAAIINAATATLSAFRERDLLNS